MGDRGRVVAVLALAGGLLVAFGPPWTSVLPGRPAAATAPPPPPIGDPRTADPCGLLNVASMQRFGQATMLRDIGYAQVCSVRIATGGQGSVWLSAMFSDAEDVAPRGVAERFGELTISREVTGAERCRRTIVLGDRSRVSVTARAYGGAATDLCTVADVGTQTAAFALSSGSLPRRSITDPPNALTWLDTCSLLDQAALGEVSGLDVSRRDPGFAGWQCSWGGNPAFLDEPWVVVEVVRSLPLSGQPVQIGGRSAKVTPGGSDEPGTCVVELVQRSYTEASGGLRVDALDSRIEALQQEGTDDGLRARSQDQHERL